jgi:hypothetical protein
MGAPPLCEPIQKKQQGTGATAVNKRLMAQPVAIRRTRETQSDVNRRLTLSKIINGLLFPDELRNSRRNFFTAIGALPVRALPRLGCHSALRHLSRAASHQPRCRASPVRQRDKGGGIEAAPKQTAASKQAQ